MDDAMMEGFTYGWWQSSGRRLLQGVCAFFCGISAGKWPIHRMSELDREEFSSMDGVTAPQLACAEL
jgi:hypothetical protein